MKRVYDFLKKAETYYLATVEGDQPRVRPFGTIFCWFVNDVRPEKAKEFCLWRIDFSDGGRA